MRASAPRRRTPLGPAAAATAAALLALAAAPAVAAAGTEPDLAVGTMQPIKGVQPGSSFSAPATFLNKGADEVKDFYVQYAVSPGLKADETYKNCTYYTVPSYDEMPASNVASCHIQQPLKPGIVYGTNNPLSLKALGSAYRDDVRVSISTDKPDPGDGGSSEPVPGTGAPLTLVEQGLATDADRQNHPDSSAQADVSAANTADFALTGDEAKGTVGDQVTETVKFANLGPAWVRGTIDTSVTTVDVRIPAGTSVVKAHDYCDKVSATHYRCGTSQSWVNPDGGESYPFVLRIDKAVGRSTGKITFTGADRPFDHNATNDVAQLVVDTGSASESGTTGGSGSTGGTTSAGSTGAATGGTVTSGGSAGNAPQPQGGGVLAATGAGDTTPLVTLAAVALVAGGGALWATRRRAAHRTS
ncbi:LPXTG cell wall anchor domain-containing protein [Streptomyces sp. 8L]|uniref:LPXTG cell wall anchor domain-containing protein n=1 Tax=Streptomyces sp. 8L TaxID=2877242 RepID=UPI001CD2E9F7|nr:LPXTG cell wall anchor domain-containing protein [Streptomyces sp. 8L]MCA1216871.1 LPXTG cell wall anchor domain-containing protein [Streptomyces sp. 8L]